VTRALIVALSLSVAASSADAEEHIADIRQGTNLSVALAPGGTTLVVDLLERLWSLPATGGGAVPLTPEGEKARSPRFSPDGGRIVYQRSSGDAQWDLWLLDMATGEQRPLTTSAYDEREPDFTPDGRTVVFASNRTGHGCLWTIALEGGVETQLTEEAGAASYPTVSEHGLVAYVLARDGESSIRVLGLSGAIEVVHTSVNRLSPPQLRGLMMGGWFASLGIGGYLSGYIGGYWDTMPHSRFFFMVVGILMAVAIPLSLMTPQIKRTIERSRI